MSEVKHLALRKYLKLRDKYGHDHAVSVMTEQENEEIFNLILRCSVPENFNEETGGFIIRENM